MHTHVHWWTLKIWHYTVRNINCYMFLLYPLSFLAVRCFSMILPYYVMRAQISGGPLKDWTPYKGHSRNWLWSDYLGKFQVVYETASWYVSHDHGLGCWYKKSCDVGPLKLLTIATSFGVIKFYSIFPSTTGHSIICRQSGPSFPPLCYCTFRRRYLLYIAFWPQSALCCFEESIENWFCATVSCVLTGALLWSSVISRGKPCAGASNYLHELNPIL
jgi:hypothetical protein